RDEYTYFRNADEAAHTINLDIYTNAMRDAAIGLYRTASEVTGWGSFRKLFYGRDEMNKKVGWDERLFAAIDLAMRVTIYGQVESTLGRAVESAGLGEIRVAATEVRAAATTAEAEARAAQRA